MWTRDWRLILTSNQEIIKTIGLGLLVDFESSQTLKVSSWSLINQRTDVTSA